MNRRWAALGGLAVLTVGAVYFFAIRSPGSDPPHPGDRFVRPLYPVGPVEDPPPEIRWRPVPDARGYEVEILDQALHPLWKGESGDTVLPFPEPMKLQLLEGKSLLYRIRAMGMLGKGLAQSDLILLRLSPPREG